MLKLKLKLKLYLIKAVIHATLIFLYFAASHSFLCCPAKTLSNKSTWVSYEKPCRRGGGEGEETKIVPFFQKKVIP